MARNPEYFGTGSAVEGQAHTSAASAQGHDRPQMVFRDHSKLSDSPASAFESPAEAWDGMLPEGWDPITHGCEGLFEAGFLPVECDAGDLLVFAGELDHLSLPNYSELPRHTFQLHAVEGPAAGIAWSPDNWLQYPDGQNFPALGVCVSVSLLCLDVSKFDCMQSSHSIYRIAFAAIGVARRFQTDNQVNTVQRRKL
jgi:hypothetical protein